MTDSALTIGCLEYDTTRPLCDGSVTVDGVEPVGRNRIGLVTVRHVAIAHGEAPGSGEVSSAATGVRVRERPIRPEMLLGAEG